MGWREAAESVLALQEAIAVSVRETMKGGSYKRFTQGWKEPNIDYGAASLREADRARDFSMYENILKAKGDNMLLYGFGYLHGERLQELLKSAKGIKYMRIDQFLADQRKKWPQ